MFVIIIAEGQLNRPDLSEDRIPEYAQALRGIAEGQWQPGLKNRLFALALNRIEAGWSGNTSKFLIDMEVTGNYIANLYAHDPFVREGVSILMDINRKAAIVYTANHIVL